MQKWVKIMNENKKETIYKKLTYRLLKTGTGLPESTVPNYIIPSRYFAQ